MTEKDAFIIKAEKALEEEDKVVRVPDKKVEETEGVLDWKKNNYFKPQSSLKPEVLERNQHFLKPRNLWKLFVGSISSITSPRFCFTFNPF